MIAVPSYIGKSKDLQSCLREVAKVLSEHSENYKIIIQYSDRALTKFAKPIEWTPNSFNESDTFIIDYRRIFSLLKEHKPESRIPPLQLEDPKTSSYIVLIYPVYLNKICVEIALVSLKAINRSVLAAIDNCLDFIAADVALCIKRHQKLTIESNIENELSTIGAPIHDQDLARLKRELENERQNKNIFIHLNSIYSEEKNLDVLLNKSLKVISNELGFEEAICFVNDNNKLNYKSNYNIPPELIATIKTSAVPEIINYVFQNQEIIFARAPLFNGEFAEAHLTAVTDDRAKVNIFVPLTTSATKEGVLVFKITNIAGFNDEQIEFLRVIVGQLTRAINQLRLIEESKTMAKKSEKLASYNAALYRFTHQLSTAQSLEDIFQNAFTIMHKELGIERFWLGLINEPGTRIIGQAAYGVGWKKKLVEINIDISGKDHPLAEIIKNRTAKIFSDVDEILGGLGLKRFIEKHNINSVGLIPLFSSGQIIGVLAFELTNVDEYNSEEQTNKMQGFASELATAIMTKRLEERLAEGETMRAAGLLAAGIAHNFNNLLQGVLGQASLLELYAQNPDQIIKSSKIISESATKGAILVRQLLSFAYLEEALKEDFGVNELIERNKISFQRLLHANQFIRYNLRENLEKTTADQKQVIKIISALLSNASEAMDNSGVVEIFTDFVEVNEANAKYEVPFGKYVIIGIRDDGKGMDLETKKRCFEPFFTTKNIDPSSGLSLSGGGMGLAASYALAKKNGGRLVVDSRLGHGSLFTLYLPVMLKQPQILHADSRSDDNIKNGDNLKSEIEIISGHQEDKVKPPKIPLDDYQKLKS